MPISLPPIAQGKDLQRTSRRRFLAGSLATATSLLLPAERLAALWGADASAMQPASDPDRFALLSDIHIAGDRRTVYRGVNMFDNLQRVCGEVGARRPAAAFVDGDLAFLHGKAEDYATVVESLKPLRHAGVPLLLTLGNHDRHDRFWSALPEEDAARKDPANHPIRYVQDGPNRAGPVDTPQAAQSKAGKPWLSRRRAPTGSSSTR